MKLHIPALLAAAALALAGCGTPTATATLPVQRPAATAAPSLSDGDFAERIRGISNYFDASTDDLIAKSGRDLCAVFTPAEGGNATTLYAQLADSITSNGGSVQDADRFIRLSVANYCPTEFGYLPK